LDQFNPALAALPQHRLVFEDAPVEAFGKEIHVVPYACHSRGNIGAKAHRKPLAERMAKVRLVEENFIPARQKASQWPVL
jgi:hypothetical protein